MHETIISSLITAQRPHSSACVATDKHHRIACPELLSSHSMAANLLPALDDECIVCLLVTRA